MQLNDSINFAMQILELNPDWVYIYDLVEKKNIYENNKSLAFLGFDMVEFEELKNNPLEKLVHPDDILKIQFYHQKIQSSEETAFSLEYRIRNKAGEYRIFSSNDTPFKKDKDGKTTQIIGTARDITRQRKLMHILSNNLQESPSPFHKKEIISTIEQANKIKRDELRLLHNSLEVIQRSRDLKQRADAILKKLDDIEPPFISRD